MDDDKLLSVDMNNLLERVRIFKQEVMSGFKREVKNELNDLMREDFFNLDESISKLMSSDNVSKKKEVFGSVIDILDVLEFILIDNSVFTDFDILSNFLFILTKGLRLNDNLKKNLIFDVVERNIKIGLFQDNALIIEQRELFKYQDRDQPIVLEEIKKNEELMQSFRKITKNIQDTHLIIKECYLDKRQKSGELKDFTLNDINAIEGALVNLGVNEEIIKSIVRVLKDKVSVVEKIPSHSPVVLQKKSKLSKKEYREIDIELRKYFYFDSNAVDVRNLNNSILVYHSLNEKDKMRCVFLLRKGGYDISTIETFLVKAQVLDFNDLNFLELYKNEYVFIFELFCEECNLVEELVEANEIVNILSSLAGDSDEFFEWNEELKRLASEMFEKISQNQKKDYIKKKIKDYEKVENWK